MSRRHAAVFPLRGTPARKVQLVLSRPLAGILETKHSGAFAGALAHPARRDAHYGPRHVTAAWASLQCCAGRAQAGLFRPGPDRYSTPARPRHALFAPCVIRFGAWPEAAVRARRDRQRERTRLQPARTPVLAPCCSAAPCSLGQPPPPCSLSRRAPVRRPARVTWPAGNCLLGGARRAALWPRRAAAQAVRGKLRPDHCLCRPHAAPGRSSGGAYP